MLTLYVLWGTEGGSIERCSSSLQGVIRSTVLVKDIKEINYLNSRIEPPKSVWKKQPWYMVLCDNEFIEEGLKEAIPEFLKSEDKDVFVLMKRGNDGKVYQCPRIFRTGKVFLREDCLLPARVEEERFCRILNGLVLEM